jgi:uncharacterized protein involved in response to NO
MDLLRSERPDGIELAVLFSYGFRPFFLLAGLSALYILALWLNVLTSGTWPVDAVPAMSWHAHEMLFGFVGAAVAGFLLTAVPNWTGMPRLQGWPLVGLTALWLAGRIAVSPVIGAPSPVLALVDLAFFPALGTALALPLIRAGKWRNIVFLLLLALMFTANLLFHLEWLGGTEDTARQGIALAAGIVLLMVSVIGGRIVPNFTVNALRRTRPDIAISARPWLDRTALIATAAMIPLDLIIPGSAAAGGVALIAAVAHGVRLSGWHGAKTFDTPILWILHVGYGWIVVALGLKAIAVLTGAGFASAWLHALTIGGFSTMILGVMSRATLGHTGRPLVLSGWTVAAYVTLTVAAAIRTVAPALPGNFYLPAVDTAGLLWVVAFALFVMVYAPMLLRPRIDGAEG